MVAISRNVSALPPGWAEKTVYSMTRTRMWVALCGSPAASSGTFKPLLRALWVATSDRYDPVRQRLQDGEPAAAAGFLAVLLALSRIPVAARALAAPGMPSRLLSPHSFRVAGVFFLLYLAFGHLPALFALPAGLGDIAAGIAAPLAARKLAQGTGGRAVLWFNAFGITDLAVAGALGALTGYQLLNVTPSAAPISELPLVLVPTVTVPLLLALHVTSIITLAKAPRPAASATGPLIPGVTPA
jgi:hypothetical protein